MQPLSGCWLPPGWTPPFPGGNTVIATRETPYLLAAYFAFVAPLVRLDPPTAFGWATVPDSWGSPHPAQTFCAGREAYLEYPGRGDGPGSVMVRTRGRFQQSHNKSIVARGLLSAGREWGSQDRSAGNGIFRDDLSRGG